MLSLKDSKLFASLTENELRQLSAVSVSEEYSAGQAIFQEGGHGNGLYVVSDGLVQISAVIDQGERRVLSRVGPGDFFGEMAVLDQEPRSATATAQERSSLIFIPREQLLKMIESSPRLAVSLVREFSLRMRDFNRQYLSEVLQAERLAMVGRFARTIVHDFKNPLHIIGLASELIDMAEASPEMRKNASARIQKQVDRLTNMINELLEFTRGPQQAVVLGPTSFAPYVEKIVEELRAEAAEKNVEVIFQTPPPDVVVLIDAKRVMHVFNNLVHNAVDAMPDGGQIQFRFHVADNEVVTEVEDSGPGLAPEIMPRLFEPFATFGKAKGTGLGLSICQRVVEDHHGWIKARNSSSGGAILSFSLPLPQ